MGQTESDAEGTPGEPLSVGPRAPTSDPTRRLLTTGLPRFMCRCGAVWEAHYAIGCEQKCPNPQVRWINYVDMFGERASNMMRCLGGSKIAGT